MSETLADMRGRFCVVTGASSGVGRATALGLAKLNAHVVMVCRDRERGEAALADIRRASGSRDVDLLLADLAGQKAVWELAAELKGRYPRIHVLVNNAGAIFGERRLGPDGLEMHFALNHLAYVTLTNLRLDVLMDSGRDSAPARVVNVASRAHRRARLDLDDLQGERRWSSLGAYANSKLANILFTRELARRLRGRGVTVNCLHPGVVASRFGAGAASWLRLFYRIARPLLVSEEAGADTAVWLAASPDVVETTGAYFVRRREVAPSAAARDDELAYQLWALSAELSRVGG